MNLKDLFEFRRSIDSSLDNRERQVLFDFDDYLRRERLQLILISAKVSTSFYKTLTIRVDIFH